MLLFLAQLTIPESDVSKAVWFVVGYVVAAVAWGIRVEIKLSELRLRQSSAEQRDAETKKLLSEMLVQNRVQTETLIRVEEQVKTVFKQLEKQTR